jgi:hypothetical protein
VSNNEPMAWAIVTASGSLRIWWRDKPADPDLLSGETLAPIYPLDGLRGLFLKGAALDVALERFRQIKQEGWTPAHDDQHTNGELAQAASCYADPDCPMGAASNYPLRGMHPIPSRWPDWEHHWWKPKDRRRDLVRAAALILAEIDRLDRNRIKRNVESEAT